MVFQSEPLPPSGRDFDIYRRVRVDLASTRMVAAEMGISQTRVCQIVDKVAAFLEEAAPATKEDSRKEQRLYVAEQVASARVDSMYATAVRAFEESRGWAHSKRLVEAQAQSPATVTSIKQTAGDARYLLAAARLAQVGAKLPAANLTAGCRWEEEEGAPSCGEVAAAEQAEEATCHPVGDCSENGVGTAYATPSETNQNAESDAAAESYEEVEDRPRLFEQSASAPVQHGTSGVLPRSEGALSRRERRARQRLLEKKLQKVRSQGA